MVEPLPLKLSFIFGHTRSATIGAVFGNLRATRNSRQSVSKRPQYRIRVPVYAFFPLALLALTGCAQSDDPCDRGGAMYRLNCAAHVPDSLSVERTSSAVYVDSMDEPVGGSVVR